MILIRYFLIAVPFSNSCEISHLILCRFISFPFFPIRSQSVISLKVNNVNKSDRTLYRMFKGQEHTLNSLNRHNFRNVALFLFESLTYGVLDQLSSIWVSLPGLVYPSFYNVNEIESSYLLSSPTSLRVSSTKDKLEIYNGQPTRFYPLNRFQRLSGVI